MLRHNPFRSLMMMLVPPLPGVGDLGAPISDNMLSVMADGRLDYSIGFGMAIDSIDLHPWLNMVR